MMTKQNLKIAVVLGLFGSLVAGCTGGDRPKLHKQPNVELIQDMMDDVAIDPQEEDPYMKGEAAVRLPPAGSVPQGFTPYRFAGDPVSASAKLKNPLANEMTPEILAIGQRKYETYCLVCHGQKGGGDGPVSVKMALKPPALISDKVRNMTDGGIFHIVTDGQGVMSSYAYQIVNERDRWALVNYVRSLQKMSKAQ